MNEKLKKICLFLLLFPLSTLGLLLGSGSGNMSCSAPPYRVANQGRCPKEYECCTEYGFCQPRVNWESKTYFRDCNGESNGLKLPNLVIALELAEREAGRKAADDQTLGFEEGSLQKRILPNGTAEWIFIALGSGKAGGEFSDFEVLLSSSVEEFTPEEKFTSKEKFTSEKEFPTPMVEKERKSLVWTVIQSMMQDGGERWIWSVSSGGSTVLHSWEYHTVKRNSPSWKEESRQVSWVDSTRSSLDIDSQLARELSMKKSEKLSAKDLLSRVPAGSLTTCVTLEDGSRQWVFPDWVYNSQQHDWDKEGGQDLIKDSHYDQREQKQPLTETSSQGTNKRRGYGSRGGSKMRPLIGELSSSSNGVQGGGYQSQNQNDKTSSYLTGGYGQMQISEQKQKPSTEKYYQMTNNQRRGYGSRGGTNKRPILGELSSQSNGGGGGGGYQTQYPSGQPSTELMGGEESLQQSEPQKQLLTQISFNKTSGSNRRKGYGSGRGNQQGSTRVDNSENKEEFNNKKLITVEENFQEMGGPIKTFQEQHEQYWKSKATQSEKQQKGLWVGGEGSSGYQLDSLKSSSSNNVESLLTQPGEGVKLEDNQRDKRKQLRKTTCIIPAGNPQKYVCF